MLLKKLLSKEVRLILRKYRLDNKLKIKIMLLNIMIFIFGTMKEKQIKQLWILLLLKWILLKQTQKKLLKIILKKRINYLIILK